MNNILQEDLEEIANTSIINWNILKDKKIFITGATRVNWFNFSKIILLKNKIDNLNIKLILLVRNKEEAEKIFGKK